MTSAVNVPSPRVATVRQHPLTEMESPSAASAVASEPSIVSRTASLCSSSAGDGAELFDDAGEHQLSFLPGVSVIRTFASPPSPDDRDVGDLDSGSASLMVRISRLPTAELPLPSSIGAT